MPRKPAKQSVQQSFYRVIDGNRRYQPANQQSLSAMAFFFTQNCDPSPKVSKGRWDPPALRNFIVNQGFETQGSWEVTLPNGNVIGAEVVKVTVET